MDEGTRRDWRREVLGAGTAPPPAKSLRVVRPIELQGIAVPARRWLVVDWVPWGVVTGLYGDGGIGKTLLAQQLQTCTAIGRHWLGLQTTRVRSFGVYCEDSEEELQRRQADINRLYGCDFSDLADMRYVSRLSDVNVMMRFEGGIGIRTPFFDQVLDEAKAFGAQLVIIDTVADTFAGNENARPEVNQYVKGCLGHLAHEIDGCVVACAHPSLTGINNGTGAGGSTGWNNAFRSRAFFHAPKEEDGVAPDVNARVLSRKKANYAAREDQIPLRWNDGAFINEGTTAETGIVAVMQRRGAERVFLDLLDILTCEGRALSPVVNSSNYAPKLFAARPERDRYSKADFKRAQEALFAKKLITTAEYGRKGDERRKIIRTPGQEGKDDDR